MGLFRGLRWRALSCARTRVRAGPEAVLDNTVVGALLRVAAVVLQAETLAHGTVNDEHGVSAAVRFREKGSSVFTVDVEFAQPGNIS